MAVLLTPVCAEMRGYDSDSSNLSCSTRRINSGLSASTAFRAFILNVPLLRKWTLVSETGKEKVQFELLLLAGEFKKQCLLLAF